MNCNCNWCKDRNNIFIQHILQLLSISQCDYNCKCFLCEITRNINCKCSCSFYSVHLENCISCNKKICNHCKTHDNKCLKCQIK